MPETAEEDLGLSQPDLGDLALSEPCLSAEGDLDLSETVVDALELEIG